MIDTLLHFRERAMQSDTLDRFGLRPKAYALVTLHRPSNVDDPGHLHALTGLLSRLSEHIPVIFPIHPRTRQRIEQADMPEGNILLTPPLGYLDFLPSWATPG